MRCRLVALCLIASCGGEARPCGPAAGVVACVDDAAITVAMTREHYRELDAPPGRAEPAPPAQLAVEAAIQVELFVAEARRRRLAPGPGSPALQRARLHRALIDDELARRRIGPSFVTDDEAAALYAREPGRVTKVDGVRVRAIYVRDGATAEAVFVQARDLDDAGFAALATQRSTDASAAAGGDLGVVDDEHSPKDLVRLVTELRVAGAVAGPRRLADGRFAIVRATEVMVAPEPIAVVLPRVKTYLARRAEEQALRELAERLRAQHRVQIFDDQLAAVTPP